jgi:hypothetical protein
MCGTTTTTTVKTGQLSDKGESYEKVFNEVLAGMLGEYGGYEVSSTSKTQFVDKAKANELEKELADIEKQLAKDPGGFQKTLLLGKQAELQKEYSSLETDTYDDFEITKKEDPRVQDAIDKYGADSPEVVKVKQQIKQQEVDKAFNLANVEANYIDSLQKFTAGDYSYTPEQAEQIGKFIDPIKGVIAKTTDDLINQYGDNNEMLQAELGKLTMEIDKTGFAVGDALKAASAQYTQSGDNLMGILEKVNESAYNKAKFEFDLLSEEADTKAAHQGALLGLPPGSMSEKLAAQKMKTDALKFIELDLAQKTATGALNIQGQVESGKQSISLAKVELANSQGAKKEGVAKMGFGLSEMLASKTENAIGNKGNALIAAEQQQQQMLYNAAYGNIPGQLQAAQAGLTFDNANEMNKFNLESSLLGAVGKPLGVEKQRQFAETTTTQKEDKGIFGGIMDVVGAGASLVGAGFGMAGGGSGGGGGGGSPTTYAPIPNIDLSTYKPASQSNFALDY